jgi:hypothetical protein
MSRSISGDVRFASADLGLTEAVFGVEKRGDEMKRLVMKNPSFATSRRRASDRCNGLIGLRAGRTLVVSPVDPV